MTAQEENAEGDEGILAEGNLAPFLVPCDVNGGRAHDAEGNQHGDVPDEAGTALWAFATEHLLVVHQEEEAEVGHWD